MTLETPDRDSLIRYRLEQAYETVADVALLIENNRLRSAINRIYYGMFYALLALGTAYRIETSKHAQLIGWFNKTFIYEGIFPKDLGRILNKAFNRRTKGDYDTFITFEKDVVIEMHQEMQVFIDTIRSFLDERN